MVYKWAAQLFNVTKGAQERYVKDNTKPLKELGEVNLGRRPILPGHSESELVKYCIEMDAICYGSRRNDVRSVAFQLAI
jgi:hypothetical protein